MFYIKKDERLIYENIKIGDLVIKKVCVVKGVKWYVYSINYEDNYTYIGKSKVGGDTLREKATNLLLV